MTGLIIFTIGVLTGVGLVITPFAICAFGIPFHDNRPKSKSDWKEIGD